MKIFVIVEKGYEYNDEYYEPKGLEGIVTGYRSEEKAQAECYRRNKARRNDDCRDSRDQPILEFFDIVELNVPDSEIYSTVSSVCSEKS